MRSKPDTPSGSTSDAITGLHLANRFVLIGLIALHLAAILWYRLGKRQNLITPMLTGNTQQAPVGSQATRDDSSMRLRAALVLALSAAAIAWLVR